jgi:hypothetical protein
MATNMKCFNCGSSKMKTIYPPGYVQKKCMMCNWKSTPVKIPGKINKNNQVICTKNIAANIFDQEWWKL